MFLGHEKIEGLNGESIKDFWQWTFSDLLIDKNRDQLGLYLVANSLELTNMPRINWGDSELRYRKKKIAVRSNGYIQSWRQKKAKRVSYDISPKKGIDAKSEDSLTFRNRSSEIYIFALLAEKDLTKLNPLDANQWKFYVVRTSVLDDQFEKNRKIGLRPLNKMVTPVHISKVKAILDDLIDLELTEKLVL